MCSFVSQFYSQIICLNYNIEDVYVICINIFYFICCKKLYMSI